MLFSLFQLAVYAQINLTDSSIQVIGYWDMHEKQTYEIITEKYKVNENDTTSREVCAYQVEISIKDSTAKSYTIDWYYKNFRIKSESEIGKKLASLAQDMHVIIKTDEMGAFVEVVNWKEIRDFMNHSISVVMKEYKDIPDIDKLTKKMQAMFSSREEIEGKAINEIQQFYTFHGGKYTLHEDINASMKVPNLYGGEPFDAIVSIEMDSINEEDDQATIRMWQTVDQKQLTDAAFDILKTIAENAKQEAPVRATFPSIENETRWASLIDGDTGWVVYSVQTKEVKSGNVKNFEETTIDIQ